MEKKTRRTRIRILIAVLLLLLTAAVWVFLFFPHQTLQELPGQARRSEALDYDPGHGGLYRNAAVYVLGAEDTDESDIAALADRIGADTQEVAEGLYLLRFDSARTALELDGIALWLEESPLVEAAFLSTLTRSPYSRSVAVSAYETEVPLLRTARTLWENQRTLAAVSGALLAAAAILLPTVLGILHDRRKAKR